MTIATSLAAALAEALGPGDDRIHTAVPPMHLGGGADVIAFRHAPSIAGVVYVSAGLCAHAGQELLACTRAPAEWAPSFVSRLAAAARTRGFVWNGSTPLGDADAPFAGVLFTSLPGLWPKTIDGHYTRFLLCIGITGAELATCRSHGTLAVVELLRRAGMFPFSEPGRGDAPGIATCGPSPRDRAGLSEHARRGLAAVIDGQDQDVESLRGDHTPRDLEILADTYADLVAFQQRSELINLTQDARAPCLVPMSRAYLRDALAHSIEPNTLEHAALAAALCRLDGAFDTFVTYYDDLDGALVKARARIAE